MQSKFFKYIDHVSYFVVAFCCYVVSVQLLSKNTNATTSESCTKHMKYSNNDDVTNVIIKKKSMSRLQNVVCFLTLLSIYSCKFMSEIITYGGLNCKFWFFQIVSINW